MLGRQLQGPVQGQTATSVANEELNLNLHFDLTTKLMRKMTLQNIHIIYNFIFENNLCLKMQLSKILISWDISSQKFREEEKESS